jgi:tRNA-dihydrouridine synthase B
MSAVRIGPYTLPNGLILAPMAGVTDQPFRQLCRRMGAGLVVSEMVTSDMSSLEQPQIAPAHDSRR